MTRKIVAGAAIAVAAFLYVVFSNQNSSGSPAAQTPAAGSGSSGSSGAGGASGQYKDGTYVGPAEDAVYGTVQVQAMVAGGKLADVRLLQYPDAPGHTSEVSAQATPILVSEALSAQSAQVDIVSGATQTSEAFQQSLGSALAHAHA